MSLTSHLEPGEEVLARAGPFYATSRRVLRYQLLRGGAEDFRQLPYAKISSVEATRMPNHRFMVTGTLIGISGVFITLTLGFFTTILAVPAGIALIILGSRGWGNQQYFQLHAPGSTPKEQALWRIPYAGSMDLMVAIQSHTARSR